MATDPYTARGIRNAFILGFSIIAVACGLQALFAPTVRVTCPARAAGQPDCELRWLVGFDMVPIRQTPLPALRSVDEILSLSNPGSRSRSGATPFTVYLQTATGPVRSILWGEHVELQGFREPIVSYLADAHAGPLEVTMWPSTNPWRLIANVIVGVGLLCWVWLPVQVPVFLARRIRS